jgi:hypothetical protein
MEQERPDYRRVKVAALQQLAAGGDKAAAEELQRRGVEARSEVDVTRLDDPALRALVRAWRDGVMPDERQRSRALAERAQFELEVRFKVDSKRWDGLGREPRPPAVAPWLAPRPARVINWQRPTGSKLYASDEDMARARFNAMARGQR